MDNGGVGAGLALHGLRRFGPESAGMERDDTVQLGPRSSLWKARASLCGVPPRFPETDDSEDYMSGLVEEIAQCMLEENEDGSRSRALDCFSMASSETPWGAQAFLSTSPQSTLAGMSSWDLLSPGASSSGGLSSGVSSPPTPVATSHLRKEEDDALDLLYAELLRLKMEDEIKARQQQLIQLKQQQHYQQLLWKMRQRQAASMSYDAAEALKFVQAGGAQLAAFSPAQKVPGNSSLYYRSKPRTEDNSQVRVRKQVTGAWGGNMGQGTRPRGWSTTDQSNQVQPQITGYASGGNQHKAVNGSGMRAVFLGTPGARESGGTGVFLPRRLGSGHDTKRKPACSTVLLPSRIVQALNLNVEDTLAPNSSPAGAFSRRDVIATRARNQSISLDVVDSRKEWEALPAAACSPLQEVAPDICLPTEWTY